MHLSPKQEQILCLVAQDCCNREIAKRLGISSRTVESHLQRLYERHNLHTRAALVAKWIMEGGRPDGGVFRTQ
ncbi:helix-turn-helix transcriptional regulator [Streptomyces javensis]|uniref:response regulator transcription factor n=1 Tax=Streptomyces javensis TaxID=114698 RepID=UPI0033F45639